MKPLETPIRLGSGGGRPSEDLQERALRPSHLDGFIGHAQLRDNLRIFIESARCRSRALDHVLLSGPPGLGKTTLAHIIARELNVGFRATSGPVLLRPGDLAAILTNLNPRDVLFIDEIHRILTPIEETLYPAMEDFHLDLIVGKGPGARTLRIDLSPFTLIAATTRSGLLSQPLRERFGIPLRLDFYSLEDLQAILLQASKTLKITLTSDGAAMIAQCSRSTPRVAYRLLRRVHDFALVSHSTAIDYTLAQEALNRLNIESNGLDVFDKKYLTCIATQFNGGPVGLETLCAALSEQSDVLEQVVEPFLLRQGLLKRTHRGRLLTQNAYHYLNHPPPHGLLFQDLDSEADVDQDL